MMKAEQTRAPRVFNVNVGVLGHVDSGKTSLVRALSTELSTTALDKHPQSRERGMTLDLGFSAFTVEIPQRFKERSQGQGSEGNSSSSPSSKELPYDLVQFTLVDCPGHASLIRTVIGGAQIIDSMILVVDVTKGIQAQTAECLVIGEILSDDMIVVMNKVDLVPHSERASYVERRRKEIRACLTDTKFADSPIIAVAAAVGGEESVGQSAERVRRRAKGKAAADSPPSSHGIDDLIRMLTECVKVPQRRPSGPFCFAFDHCFQIRGKGTILTGTILSGSVKLNDMIELPQLKIQKKVKSMQMFHRPVDHASQGDRVGLCVAGLDAKSLERGIAATPNSVPALSQVIALVHRVRFYQDDIKSKTKFHLTIGHTTVMGTAVFFAHPSTSLGKQAEPEGEKRVIRSPLPSYGTNSERTFNWDAEYHYQEQLGVAADGETIPIRAGQSEASTGHWVLLRLEQPVYCPPESIIIASKLDADVHSEKCRIAFYGRIIDAPNTMDKEEGPRGSTRPMVAVAPQKTLRIIRYKRRQGTIARRVDHQDLTQGCKEVIIDGLFSKESDLSQFFGLHVVRQHSGEVGTISAAFGKSGKVKVRFSNGTRGREGDTVILPFKRYVSGQGRAEQRALRSSKGMLQDDAVIALCLAEQRSEAQVDTATSQLEELDTTGGGATGEVVAERQGSSSPMQQSLVGTIERLKGETTSDGKNPMAICAGLFSSSEEAERYIDSEATTELGEQGVISSVFGKLGKVRVTFTGGTAARAGCKVFVQRKIL